MLLEDVGKLTTLAKACSFRTLTLALVLALAAEAGHISTQNWLLRINQ